VSSYRQFERFLLPIALHRRARYFSAESVRPSTALGAHAREQVELGPTRSRSSPRRELNASTAIQTGFHDLENPFLELFGRRARPEQLADPKMAWPAYRVLGTSELRRLVDSVVEESVCTVRAHNESSPGGLPKVGTCVSCSEAAVKPLSGSAISAAFSETGEKLQCPPGVHRGEAPGASRP